MTQFELDDSDDLEPLDAEAPRGPSESAAARPARGRRKRPPPENIDTFVAALDYAEPRPPPSATSGKGPYGTALSNAIAVLAANRLRADFPGVLPTPDGKGGESRARTSRGFKKLDVNYSTPVLGLALGVSIKTVNYCDPGTKRYTKNYSRNDNELRAEATDYHQRQPYAILAAILFLPADACDDAGVGTGEDANQGISSFGAAVRYFRDRRVPRLTPDDESDMFEAFYVGLYEHEGARRGDVMYFDVVSPPPRSRRPTADEALDLEGVIARIRSIYDMRNNPPFEWAE